MTTHQFFSSLGYYGVWVVMAYVVYLVLAWVGRKVYDHPSNTEKP